MAPPSRQRWTFEHAGVRVQIDALVFPAERDEDRVGVAIDENEGRISFVLADGAGNSGRGRAAAEIAVARAGSDVEIDPVDRVRALDAMLARIGAEAAIVIAEITSAPAGLDVRGASAGDARLWAHRAGRWVELTLGVPRKPLVGSGARPTGFALAGADHILCATDGLAMWPGPDDDDAVSDDFALRLPDRARLPNGRVADDLAIVSVRVSASSVASSRS